MLRKFDISDFSRKLKIKITECTCSSYRRVFLCLVGLCVLFYLLPILFYGYEKNDTLLRCMDDRLTPYILEWKEFDANIRHVPPLPGESNFIPYVGNGYFGLAITQGATFNIKYGLDHRAVQRAIGFQPLIAVRKTGAPRNSRKEATVVEYNAGIVHKFQCFNDYFVSQSYYAHRTHSGIFMQEVQITNTNNALEDIELQIPQETFQNKKVATINLKRPLRLGFLNINEIEITTTTFFDNSSSFIAISFAQPKVDQIIQLRKRGTYRFVYPIAIYYSKPIKQNQISETIGTLKIQAADELNKVLNRLTHKSDLQYGLSIFRQEHINVWNDIWATGFSISTSKAENSLNGDRINATMYAVLSQVRSFEYETSPISTASMRQDIAKALVYAEGCYGSYHTLQAANLWRPMGTLEELNSLVWSWILTLEKQGCHNLIRAGASGVIQAMVLSFGSFKFKNQHLECNIEPKYLHRDFHFRRLNYGEKTHVNVTINVTEANKAIINVVLDRSDRNYYACDAGCLDKPVLLKQNRHQFPVKITDPPTAILYITEDKKHMEELNRAIHVKEIFEAPAHEKHVIALHKHGNHLGNLPVFFWVSICLIIIVFHIFLCKLIIKEYCDPSDKIRYRYNKP